MGKNLLVMEERAKMIMIGSGWRRRRKCDDATVKMSQINTVTKMGDIFFFQTRCLGSLLFF